jgi:hypothetical protein
MATKFLLDGQEYDVAYCVMSDSASLWSHNILVFNPGGKLKGILRWGEDGEIIAVRVHSSLRRRGIASTMLAEARRHDFVFHAADRTSDGNEWASSTGDQLPSPEPVTSTANLDLFARWMEDE